MHRLLEGYLAEVSAQLDPLPVKRKEEELREIRAHLERSFTAQLESGSREEGASAMVLRQFGPPQPLGRKILWAWRRERLLDWRGFWGAAVFSLALTYVPNLPGLIVHSILPLLLPLPHDWQSQSHLQIPDWLLQKDIVLLLMPSYLLCGVLCGLVFPKRGVTGTTLTTSGLLLLYISSNLHFLAGEIVRDKLLTSLFLVQWAICPLTAILGSFMSSRIVLRKRRSQPA